MDAKCPQCDRVAILDDKLENVKCHNCGFEANYDHYLELMKEKVGLMSENFRFERPGF